MGSEPCTVLPDMACLAKPPCALVPFGALRLYIIGSAVANAKLKYCAIFCNSKRLTRNT
jgi:hypothetical protein